MRNALLGTAPDARLPEPRKPGSVYALRTMQLSDWLTDGPGRAEIEATCRRWMDELQIDEVRVMLESGEPVGSVRR